MLLEQLKQQGKKIKLNAIDVSRFKLEVKSNDYKQAVQNAKAQLEYQENRQLNLDLLSKFGSNAWIINNDFIEQKTKIIQDKIDDIDQELLEINMKRKQEQMFAKKKLDGMIVKQRDLVNRIVQIRMANAKLELELKV